MRNNQPRRGNYSLLMGLMLVPILGFGALGVDISYVASSNGQAQAVADAASHAALLAYQNSDSRDVSSRMDAGKQAAQWIVDNNRVGDGPGDMTRMSFGIFNPHSGGFREGGSPPNGVRVEVSRRGGNGVPTILAGIIGHSQFDVEQFGTTASNPREMIMVTDLSGSMYQGIGLPNSQPNSQGRVGSDGVWYATAHEATRDAMVAFAGYLVERQVPRDRLGVTVFAEEGLNWMPAAYLSTDSSDIMTSLRDWGVPNASTSGAPRSWSGDAYAVAHQNGQRWYYGTSGNKKRGLAYGANRRDDCEDLMEAQFRWEGWGKYPNRPNVCDIGTCTNPGPAVWLAIDELTGRASDPLAFKGIVVISDGMPTCGDGASGLLRATEYAWNERGIHVWTVAYDGSDGIDAALMEKAAKGMGTYQETPTQEGLSRIMVDIARSIPVAIVE